MNELINRSLDQTKRAIDQFDEAAKLCKELMLDIERLQAENAELKKENMRLR